MTRRLALTAATWTALAALGWAWLGTGDKSYCGEED